MQAGRLLLQAVLVWMLLAGQGGSVARAGEAERSRIEVFTVADHPLTGVPAATASPGAPAVEIYLLDGIQHIEAVLSAGLSADPQRSANRVLGQVKQLDGADRERIERAAAGLVRASHYGITRYPAVVFDARAVVYGLTDLDAAWRHYRAWRAGASP
ncbi:MAG: TIGR03757 family integrating conjugative element protein [Gammaproteobacteria bacterium]|nr:TIGR03757 family integrating conjugative element protein [Gammaproteobacteria bacterium]